MEGVLNKPYPFSGKPPRYRSQNPHTPLARLFYPKMEGVLGETYPFLDKPPRYQSQTHACHWSVSTQNRRFYSFLCHTNATRLPSTRHSHSHTTSWLSEVCRTAHNSLVEQRHQVALTHMQFTMMLRHSLLPFALCVKRAVAQRIE